MNTAPNLRRALGVASGLTLAVAGGVSALFFTVGTGISAQAPTPETATTDADVALVADTEPLGTAPEVIVEYVDQYGNPLAAAGPVSEPQGNSEGQGLYEEDHQEEHEEEHEDDH